MVFQCPVFIKHVKPVLSWFFGEMEQALTVDAKNVCSKLF